MLDGTFNCRIVEFSDGRSGVFEVYYDGSGNPLELGPARKSAEARAEADAAPMLRNPEAWPGLPPVDDFTQIVEHYTDEHGNEQTKPVDAETIAWILEEEASDRETMKARRAAYPVDTF